MWLLLRKSIQNFKGLVLNDLSLYQRHCKTDDAVACEQQIIERIYLEKQWPHGTVLQSCSRKSQTKRTQQKKHSDEFWLIDAFDRYQPSSEF